MHPFPDRLEAGDTLLRRMAEADLPTVGRHLSDPAIARWMAGARHPFTAEDATEILTLARDPAQRIRVLDSGGAMIGCLGLSPDVWFWLDPEWQGRGVMARAMRAACDAHFTVPAHPLVATCRDDNPASQRLLAGLGFARKPERRRMFFAVEGCSVGCHDHVMTSGQWMVLHPPRLSAGDASLRPANLKDANRLAPMLPRRDQGDTRVWPLPADLPAFIESNRCRSRGAGLFVIEDSLGRLIGMALLSGPDRPAEMLFSSVEDDRRHRTDVTATVGATR